MNFLHMTIGVHFCSLSVIGFPLSRCQYTVTLACGCDCFFSVYAKLRSILMMIGQSNDLFMVFASRRLSFFSDIIKWWTNSTLRSFYRLSQSPISALYTVLLVVSSKRWRRLRNAIKFKCRQKFQFEKASKAPSSLEAFMRLICFQRSTSTDWLNSSRNSTLFIRHAYTKKIDTDQIKGFIEGQHKEYNFVAQKMILSELSTFIFIAGVFSLVISCFFGRLGI